MDSGRRLWVEERDGKYLCSSECRATKARVKTRLKTDTCVDKNYRQVLPSRAVIQMEHIIHLAWRVLRRRTAGTTATGQRDALYQSRASGRALVAARCCIAPFQPPIGTCRIWTAQTTARSVKQPILKTRRPDADSPQFNMVRQ